jgi:hypothetical protein
MKHFRFFSSSKSVELIHSAPATLGPLLSRELELCGISRTSSSVMRRLWLPNALKSCGRPRLPRLRACGCSAKTRAERCAVLSCWFISAQSSHSTQLLLISMIRKTMRIRFRVSQRNCDEEPPMVVIITTPYLHYYLQGSSPHGRTRQGSPVHTSDLTSSSSPLTILQTTMLLCSMAKVRRFDARFLRDGQARGR